MKKRAYVSSPQASPSFFYTRGGCLQLLQGFVLALIVSPFILQLRPEREVFCADSQREQYLVVSSRDQMPMFVRMLQSQITLQASSLSFVLLPLLPTASFVCAQSSCHGYTNFPACTTRDPCVWSNTSAVCSATGSTSTGYSSSANNDPSTATAARFGAPMGAAAPNFFPNASTSLVYISDFDNNAIRILNTYAATTSTLVAAASLNGPYHLAFFPSASNVNPL